MIKWTEETYKYILIFTWLNSRTVKYLTQHDLIGRDLYFCNWMDIEIFYTTEWTERNISHDWMDRDKNISHNWMDRDKKYFTQLNGQWDIYLHDWMDTETYFIQLNGHLGTGMIERIQTYFTWLNGHLGTAILHDWMDQDLFTWLNGPRHIYMTEWTAVDRHFTWPNGQLWTGILRDWMDSCGQTFYMTEMAETCIFINDWMTARNR